jgi:hypothetical protein
MRFSYANGESALSICSSVGLRSPRDGFPQCRRHQGNRILRVVALGENYLIDLLLPPLRNVWLATSTQTRENTRGSPAGPWTCVKVLLAFWGPSWSLSLSFPFASTHSVRRCKCARHPESYDASTPLLPSPRVVNRVQLNSSCRRTAPSIVNASMVFFVMLPSVASTNSNGPSFRLGLI